MERTLSDLRKAAGFKTQGALAEKIGVERVTVSRWESGDREPRLSMISLLAEALHTTDGEIVSAITCLRERKEKIA